MQKITLIAAIDRQFGIGFKGCLPWHIKEDLKDFQTYTLGKPMIMGRLSYESIGSKPLANREMAIVSSTATYPNATVVKSLDQAIRFFADAPEIIIAGGAKIYQEALERCTHMRLTHIDHIFECDTYFPPFNPQLFKVIDQTPLVLGKQHNYKIEVITYKRIDII